MGEGTAGALGCSEYRIHGARVDGCDTFTQETGTCDGDNNARCTGVTKLGDHVASTFQGHGWRCTVAQWWCIAVATATSRVDLATLVGTRHDGGALIALKPISAR
mgnify:CR=1 FL=1